MATTHTIGRRKTSVARIYLSEGSGTITVNKRTFDDYFPSAIQRQKVKEPLTLLELGDQYDIIVNVYGGGTNGQAEAIRLAISKSLVELNPENKPVLKSKKFLTRDPRMVERKKFGQKKARKKFQFSKR